MSKDSLPSTKAQMGAAASAAEPPGSDQATDEATGSDQAADEATGSDQAADEATGSDQAADEATGSDQATVAEQVDLSGSSDAEITEVTVSEDDPEAAQQAIDEAAERKAKEELDLVADLGQTLFGYADTTEAMKQENVDLVKIVDHLEGKLDKTEGERDSAQRERDQFEALLKLPAGSDALNKLREILVAVSGRVETSRSKAEESARPKLKKYEDVLKGDTSDDESEDDSSNEPTSDGGEE